MSIVSRNCNECQVEYNTETKYLNRGQGLFCSQSCSSRYFGRKRSIAREPNTMCSWCGIDFYRKESSKKSKSGLYFCSREHQSKAFADGQHPVTPGPSISSPRPRLSMRGLKCIVCHEEFPSKGRQKNPVHRECQYLLNRAYIINTWLSGDNESTLIHSKTTGKPNDTKDFVKEYLLDTRGDRCERCGFDTHGPYGSIIQMDHINGNCFDNRTENLALLCPNCHAMTSTYGSRNKGSGRAHRRKS